MSSEVFSQMLITLKFDLQYLQSFIQRFISYLILAHYLQLLWLHWAELELIGAHR